MKNAIKQAENNTNSTSGNQARTTDYLASDGEVSQCDWVGYNKMTNNGIIAKDGGYVLDLDLQFRYGGSHHDKGLDDDLPLIASIIVDLIKSAAERHQGKAADEFVIEFERNAESCEMAVRDIRGKLLFSLDLSGSGLKEHQVADRISLIVATIELASRFGITGWAEGFAYRAGQEWFQSKLGQLITNETQQH
jgi:hypothetical protein